ncbi:MAG: hypothetical protein NTV31_00445 [Bacteroidia bacterium]|nr:hypothetical protein [Bacteroidia bacterium]
MKNSKFGIRLFYVTLLLMVINASINGQSKLDGFALLNPKFGIYGSFKGGLPGYVFGDEINFLKKKLIFSLDYYHCKFTYIGSKEEKFDQFDFLFGKYLDFESFRLQIQGGLGTFKGITYNESEKIFTLGIPLKVGLKYLISNSFSIGLDLQANLNLKYPIYMPMLSIEIGKLKNVL